MTRHTGWITTTYFFLAFYTFGASMLDSFALYHTWRFVGAEEFPLMHMESGTRIVKVFVIPTAVMTIFQILLFWHRPRIIPKILVWLSFVCCVVPWISSALIQIPIQLKLDKAKDAGLLEWLIVSDWIRVVPAVGLAITGFLMLNKVVNKSLIKEKATTS